MLREDLGPVGEGRIHGPHISEVIRHRYAKIRGWSTTIRPEDETRIAAGFAWEWAVELVLAGVPADEALRQAWKRYKIAVRVPPAKQLKLVLDGENMTPDALRIEPGRRVLESYKLSSKSSKKAESAESFAEHFAHWIEAEAAYCHGINETMPGPMVTVVEFYVLWTNGNYRFGDPGGGMQEHLYEVEFTPEELRAIWHMLKAERREMGLEEKDKQEQEGTEQRGAGVYIRGTSGGLEYTTGGQEMADTEQKRAKASGDTNR